MAMNKQALFELARLAKLDLGLLDEAEVDKTLSDLQAIVAHIESLSELDLEGVPPTQHPTSVQLKAAPDEPAASDKLEQILANAPRAEGGYILMPRVLGSAAEGE